MGSSLTNREKSAGSQHADQEGSANDGDPTPGDHPERDASPPAALDHVHRFATPVAHEFKRPKAPPGDDAGTW